VHTPLPVNAQNSRAALEAKLREHDDALNALEAAGGGLIVQYTATGSETNSFTVSIGATMSGSYYVNGCAVGGSGGGDPSSIQIPYIPLSGRTSTQFTVKLAQQPAAGDVYQFIVLGAQA